MFLLSTPPGPVARLTLTMVQGIFIPFDGPVHP
jgi:hypothetical protein